MEFIHYRNENDFNAAFEPLLHVQDLDEVDFKMQGSRFKPITNRNLSFYTSICRWFQNFFSNRRERVILGIFAFIKENNELAIKKKSDIAALSDRLILNINPRDRRRVQEVFDNIFTTINAFDQEINKNQNDLLTRSKKLDTRQKEIDKIEFLANQRANKILADAELAKNRLADDLKKLTELTKKESEKINYKSLDIPPTKRNEIDLLVEARKLQIQHEINEFELQLEQFKKSPSEQSLNFEIICRDGKVLTNINLLQDEIPYIKTLKNMASIQSASLDVDEPSDYQLSLNDPSKNVKFSEKSVRNLLLILKEKHFLKANGNLLFNHVSENLHDCLRKLDIIFEQINEIILNAHIGNGQLPESSLVEIIPKIKRPIEIALKLLGDSRDKFNSASVVMINDLKSIDVHLDITANIPSLFNRLLIHSSAVKSRNLLNEEIVKITECINLVKNNTQFVQRIQQNYTIDHVSEIIELFSAEELIELNMLADYFSYKPLQTATETAFNKKTCTFDELEKMMQLVPYDAKNKSLAICEKAKNFVQQILPSPLVMTIPTGYLLHFLKVVKIESSPLALFQVFMKRFHTQMKEKDVSFDTLYDENIGGKRLIDYVNFELMNPEEYKSITYLLPSADRKKWDNFFIEKAKLKFTRVDERFSIAIVPINDKKAAFYWRVDLIPNVLACLNLQGKHQLMAIQVEALKISVRIGHWSAQPDRIFIEFRSSHDTAQAVSTNALTYNYKITLGDLEYDSKSRLTSPTLIGVDNATDNEAVVYYKPEQLKSRTVLDKYLEFKYEIEWKNAFFKV
ncbi:MAG: hypothetical protein H0W88_09735 [Parachlamydiaceae bacterium]|nr:hypothetical protein [Parachlamydiaceae bacterium]